MTAENEILWAKLKAFELDDINAQLSFTDRLARENGWMHEFSVRAVIEYKKFMFLVRVSGQSLTPSDEIDQVWHLHLLYTYSYWKEMCTGILQKEIHHGPTRGGRAEAAKFIDAYTKTLALYKHYFEVDPPGDIWPAVHNRFRHTNFQRVNLATHWIIKKPFT